MPVPQHIFDPPFNIVRSSHVVLDVVDLNASREFYENTVGLHVEDRDDRAVYLRGSEEHQHHSLVLRKAAAAACNRLSFKVGNETDLDKAAAFFSENGIAYAFAKLPFQGRTLQFTDPFGFQIELYATMEKRPHLLRRYDLYKGCHPQRLDHFNVFAAEVQDTVDFYARLGFRLTEYGEEDGPNGRIAAAWMHRKGNVHDLGARARPPRHFKCVFSLYPRPRRPSPGTLHQRLFHRGSRPRTVALVAQGSAAANAMGRARAALVVRTGLAIYGTGDTRTAVCRRCHDCRLESIDEFSPRCTIFR